MRSMKMELKLVTLRVTLTPIDPGHDGWVVGNEPAEVIEFHGAWGE